MPKNTYSLSAQGVAAASAGYVLGIVEGGPLKTLRAQRLTIWNPGMQTTAGLMTLKLVQQTTVGSGSTTTAPPADPASPVYSGTVRLPGATAGTQNNVVWTGQVYVPAAVGVAAPVVFDFTNNGNDQQPRIYSGCVAPLSATAMSNNSWYEIASLGNTVWNTYTQGGLAAPVIGSIIQANGAGTGTGTVTPLVLATALSAGTTYSIASLGTTTTAQWQAVGAGAYVNVGTTFQASGAAVGTGLCVAMGSGAGLALINPNAAAGAASLSYTLEFTEG